MLCFAVVCLPVCLSPCLYVSRITPKVVDEFLRKFLEECDILLAKKFNFVLIWITIRIEDFLMEFVPMWDGGNFCVRLHK